MISDDFQSLITRLSVLMLFALSLLYIEYSIHSSYTFSFSFSFFQKEIFFFFVIRFIPVKAALAVVKKS